jgi:hypothetical protein
MPPAYANCEKGCDEMKKCEGCGAELGHDWEIYGGIGDTLCADCWYDMIGADQPYDEVYGIAPHHHDLTRTGSIIGSTVFDELEGEPDEEGWYHITEKVWYIPDQSPDGEGMGMWRYWR